MKCDICGKPSKTTETSLRQGPNGFRRYKLCPKCNGGGDSTIKAHYVSATENQRTQSTTLTAEPVEDASQ